MRRQSQRGFTLIEIMIAASLAVIIVGGLIMITNNAFKQSSSTTTQTRSQTNTQAITRMLTNDLRSANATTSRGHSPGNTCAFIATATNWISYCNTPDGAHRAETTRSAITGTPTPNQPVSSSTTFITDVGGHVTISLNGSQFLTRIQPSPKVNESQLAITTRIGGN